jgi:hypothetical protein
LIRDTAVKDLIVSFIFVGMVLTKFKATKWIILSKTPLIFNCEKNTFWKKYILEKIIKLPWKQTIRT